MEYLKQHGMTAQKVAYYGHTRAWSQKGAAVSALIAAALVFFSGSYRSVFLWSIIPYIGGMLLIASYPKELDFSCDEEGCDDEPVRGFAGVVRTLKNFFQLFRKGGVRRALLNSSLFDAVFKTVKDYVQPVLKGLALSLPVLTALSGNQRVALLTGIVYTVLYLMTSVASSRASSFHDRFPSRVSGLNITWLAGAAAVAGIALFLMAGIRTAAVLLFIVYYLIENLRRPATLGFLSDRIKGSVMATGLSGESQLKTLLVAVLAPLFGLAADSLGVGAALLCIAALPVVLYPLLRFRDEGDSMDPL